MTITPQSILRFTVGLAVTAVILYLMWFFSAVVIYILVSAVLAIMGRPLVNKLSELSIRGRHLPRWCAATITLIVIWVVFATIFSLFIPLIFGKINEFASLDFSSVLASIEEPIAQAQAYIQHTFAMPETQFSLTDTLATTLKNLIDYDTINNAFSSIVSIAISTLITIFSISFITFFFLKEDGLFYAMVKAMFPERLQENVTRALDSITYLLSRYFTGILTESIILIITKVEDPEELDTRFSKFAPFRGNDKTDTLQLDGADNIIDIFQKLYEAKMKSTQTKDGKSAQNTGAKENDDTQVPDVNLIRLYEFDTLDDVIAAAHGLNGYFTGTNTLYKDPADELYKLVLHQSSLSPEDFNRVCNILTEYGQGKAFSLSGEAYLTEHGELISDSALQQLIQL